MYPTTDAALAARPSPERPADDLGDQLAALTRVLLDAATVEQALRQVASAAVVVIPHSELVSITLREQAGRFFTPIETDAVALELDRVQYEAGGGPCVDAARPEGPGYSLVQDLSGGTPWPQFAAVATRHGFGSVLSTALQPAGEPAAVRGALNVYSHREGITEDDRHRALLLATHGSLALARTRTAEVAELQHTHLRRAIESRDVIGQAKGILMARQGLTAEQAFQVLRRTSQDLNVKLADIATTLVDRHTETPRR
ncbi:ANTAR domain-containing protein [Amycolatopsis eburnea]|uniref:ANTAR domain-containing protein n=1 Tax=Amycolatopsis eburnea TaxID=2267691 RepID=A0A427TET6_9PSEU|nr:ANTAR domain-containing protein [Amycolatopsis eburnea]